MSTGTNNGVCYTFDYIPRNSSRWHRCSFRNLTEIRSKLVPETESIRDTLEDVVKLGTRPTNKEVLHFRKKLLNHDDFQLGKRTWLAEELHCILPYSPKGVYQLIAARTILKIALDYLGKLLSYKVEFNSLTLFRRRLRGGSRRRIKTPTLFPRQSPVFVVLASIPSPSCRSSAVSEYRRSGNRHSRGSSGVVLFYIFSVLLDSTRVASSAETPDSGKP